MTQQYDLAVIGGGSGGLACAQRAAQYGARVVLLEPGRLGGACVNVGCVPKKIMWNAANFADELRAASAYGFSEFAFTHDWAVLKKRRDAYITRLNDIYAQNLQKRGVDFIAERARFVEAGVLQAGDQRINASRIVIATGTRPSVPPIVGANLGIDSDGFFELAVRPQRVALVGSGYIAIELAAILAGLGSTVTLIIRGEQLLRGFDEMLSAAAWRGLEDAGVTIIKNTVLEKIQTAENGSLRLFSAGFASPLAVDCLLWAIGRAPVSRNLGLERAGVSLNADGYIVTDKYQETNIAGIYAIGDVTGRVPLTPVAIAAGRRLSDRLFGTQPERYLDYDNIATAVFGNPPMGTVGLSEHEARRQYGARVKVYSSDFVPLYYSMMDQKPRTHMKLVTVDEEERILGVHIAGPGADEILQGFAVALRMGARKCDLDDTVAIHPTSAEELVTMR
jgi:glutathione reductase (NADPH)